MNALRTFLAILFCSTLFVLGQSEPTAPFTPTANPPRYVIIVEKTEATRRYNDAIRQAVFDLVYQGAGGEMADGSVFEIWIYGEDTTTRGFLPEMLRPDNHLLLAQRASAYVRGFQSEGEGDMPEFAEHVRNLAAVAFETTLFLISSPETRLNGTTIDREINEIFAVHAVRMAEEGKPFITTFRVQDGALANYSISETALAMAVPPMPPSKVSELEKETMIADARAALKTAAEEKIQIELKVAEPPVEESAPKKITRRIPDDEREGAIILRGNPNKTTTPERPTEVVSTEQIAEPVPAPNEAPNEKSVVVVEEMPEKVSDAVESVEPVQPEPVIAVDPESTVPPTVGEESVVTTAADEVSADATPISPGTKENGNPPDANPKTFAVQPQTWMTAGGLLVAGLLFFVVAGVLIWIAVRRSRAAAGPSFITRSINERKN